jgi:hypothetical protein
MSKIIYGSVNLDGTIESGIGFEVQKSDVGIYQITFDNPFTKRPTVVATQCFSNADSSDSWDDISANGGDTRDNVVVIAVKEDSCKLKTGNSGGIACDRKFGFIAIGE